MDLHEGVALRLAGFDQRYTSQRRSLVEILAAAGRPITIPELLSKAPSLSQSSAYRNIGALMDACVVRRIDVSDDHGRFELAEELSGHHHHHVVCSNCGKVDDVPPTARLERALAEAARATADERGYVIREHRFDLVGLCEDCQTL